MSGDDVAVGLGVTVAVIFILVMGAIFYIFVWNRHSLPGQQASTSRSPGGAGWDHEQPTPQPGSPVARRSWVDEVDEVHNDVLKRLGIDLDQDSDEETTPPKAGGGSKWGSSGSKKWKKRGSTASRRPDRSTGVEAFDKGGDDGDGDDDDDGIIRSQQTRHQGLDIISEANDDSLVGSFSWTPADTVASENITLSLTRGRSTAVAADPEREPLTGGPPPASIQPIHPFTPQAERSRSSISRTIVLRRESQL